MKVNKLHIRPRKLSSVHHCSEMPPLTSTRINLSAHAACDRGPLMMSLSFYIEHQSFNEMLIGVFSNQRMLLCMRSGWVPTSVLFLPIAEKRCFVACLAAPQEDALPIVCEQTYRGTDFSRRCVYADVMLEREHYLISTDSFDLYVFVRDLFAAMKIPTRLQFVPKK
jgi:hypothetical protein